MQRTSLLSLATTAAFAAGCYAPDLRDCSVTCQEPTDCADGQVCNAQGYCADEGVTCGPRGGGGAAVDAGGHILLRVVVEGTGRVVVEGVGACDDSECLFQVPRQVLRFRAEPIDPDKPFDKWLTHQCEDDGDDESATCTFLPSSSTTVGAKFK